MAEVSYILLGSLHRLQRGMRYYLRSIGAFMPENNYTISSRLFAFEFLFNGDSAVSLGLFLIYSCFFINCDLEV